MTTATITDAGTRWLISGSDDMQVRGAACGLRDRGGEWVERPHRVGDKWFAVVRKPLAIEMDQCTVQRFGLALEITGPSREAVETKTREFLQLGSKIVCEIYESAGKWHAHLDRPPPGVMVV